MLVKLVSSLMGLLLAVSAWAQQPEGWPHRVPPSKDPARTANGLALRPPMGWNSWNRYECAIDERLIREQTDAIVASGLRDAGYEYVVVDDCWQAKTRTPAGELQADPVRFPSGMKALADHVHAKGLKFGIYSDAGQLTCAKFPGSQGHEYQDAATFARWGVDYLKYDWCYTGSRDGQEAYALIADALKATGRPIILSICEWGSGKPEAWAPRIGNLWRTTGDITDLWDGKWEYRLGIMQILDLNEPLHDVAGPGRWNDPDMLEVGNHGLSDTEGRSHFSLWAMMAAPLITGTDAVAMSPATRETLANREVIAVDQDRLGQQGRRVWRDGMREVWVRALEGGEQAIVLFNRGDRPADVTVRWGQLGIDPAIRLAVRDLWAHRDLPAATGSFTARAVPAHGVVMLRVRPTA